MRDRVGTEIAPAAAASCSTTADGAAATETTEIRLYDGFEPSGRMHIAQGVFKAVNVNKCTATPHKRFVFWVADWFALMNDKMGGDLEAIKTTGEYLIQVWKAAGMNLAQVEFQWASTELTGEKATQYWPLMLDVARRFNVTRIQKCCQIMGRLEGNLTAAQVLYPLMQCTDVFFLRAHICQLGLDQRKVNMLAREYADAAKKRKPVILSHHMLYGLKQGQEKMSKSDPDSAIFMEDAAADVERKIRAAYCPSRPAAEEDGDNLKNPCLDYIQHIIFSPEGATFTAGGVVYDNYEDVQRAFLSGALSEDDLKTGLIDALNQLLEPVRQHFTHDATAKQLLADVQAYKAQAAAGTIGTSAADRRLDLTARGTVPAQSHLVLAPLPTAKPTLQEAMNVVAQLRQAAASQPMVLMLQDWCAIVCNAVAADAKAIKAYYTVLLTSLQTLDADLMASVKVVWQSEAILQDPSNYWISVINVGRHFSLKQVMGPDMEESEGVGLVIARLMRVADVVSVAPKSCALNSVLEQELVEGFFAAKLQALAAPAVRQTTCRSIRLQPERESEALRLDTDEFYLLDDPKVRVCVRAMFFLVGERSTEHVHALVVMCVCVCRIPTAHSSLPFTTGTRQVQSEQILCGRNECCVLSTSGFGASLLLWWRRYLCSSTGLTDRDPLGAERWHRHVRFLRKLRGRLQVGSSASRGFEKERHGGGHGGSPREVGRRDQE